MAAEPMLLRCVPWTEYRRIERSMGNDSPSSGMDCYLHLYHSRQSAGVQLNRREAIAAVTAPGSTAPFPARAQQAAKIARIGYLSPNLATVTPVCLRASVEEGMRDLGKVESRNS